MDIGMDLQEAYNDGYEQGKKDAIKYSWIPVSERLPENNEAVNITYVNHDPESYYSSVKDKPFTATGVYFSGSWQCVRKYTNKGREKEYSYLHRLEYDNPNKYEVIGNRFDNPELLKGK